MKLSELLTALAASGAGPDDEVIVMDDEENPMSVESAEGHPGEVWIFATLA